MSYICSLFILFIYTLMSTHTLAADLKSVTPSNTVTDKPASFQITKPADISKTSEFKVFGVHKLNLATANCLKKAFIKSIPVYVQDISPTDQRKVATGSLTSCDIPIVVEVELMWANNYEDFLEKFTQNPRQDFCGIGRVSYLSPFHNGYSDFLTGFDVEIRLAAIPDSDPMAHSFTAFIGEDTFQVTPRFLPHDNLISRANLGIIPTHLSPCPSNP